MKYSYNWLRELSGTKLSPEKSADLLTMHSFELEGLEKAGAEFEGVVVGKILEVNSHPNAERLQIARVDVGKAKSLHFQPLRHDEYIATPPLRTGEGVLQIVCGAPNIAVGQKVPVAIIGSKLPNGLEIKAAEIRGEKSFGMLCAKDELGLGVDHSGIMILKNSAKIGESFATYLRMDDTIFEIKVLPDRAHDALSHVGVAREIAVLEGKKMAYDFDGLKLPSKKTKKLKVEIKDKDLCSRYIGAVMENVEIKDSPEWMKKRLRTSGIRTINNVVDATNYVMIELGQPMHAFDAEKLKVKNSKLEIVVRRAKDGEKMVLLDESQIELKKSDLLITNGETPLALAGVMGGENSGIDENTKTIILEAANFNAVNVRRTRSRLNLKTDASDRFEKDLDPNLAEKAMVRLIEILEHTAGAKLEGIEDVYPKKVKSWKIKLDLEYANSLLGEDVSQKEVVKVLNSLGIKTIVKSHKLECEIPTFRVDLKTQEDLIEEIGRVRGYDKIAPQAMCEPVEPSYINEQNSFERQIKNVLVGLGFDEMYNYSFYSREDAKKCGLHEAAHFELANPMSPEQALVRASMAPNILKNIKENLKNFEEFNIFETGRTYSSEKVEIKERRIIFAAQVFENNEKESFYLAKGNLENLLESLGIKKGISYKENETLSNDYWCNAPKSAKVEINGMTVGYVGEFSSLTLGKYKIKNPVSFFDLDAEKLLAVVPKVKKYHSIVKFPTVTRDISMIIPEGVSYFEIEKLAKKSGGQLINDVSLFDYFKAKKSLAIRVTLNAKDRTLESAEVDAVMEKIVLSLEKELQVEVRK